MNPETLMARIEAGTVSLGSTDKNYKLYVHNAGGEAFKQTYRNCPRESSCTPEDCTHWVTRDQDQTKFYFMHLDAAQRQRFVDLYNEKKLKFGSEIGFYVLPFFMAPISAR